MKISVVNPPFRNGRFSRTSRSPAIVKSGTMYWPFWLSYLVGGLERAGHTVQFLDCPARGIRREDLSRTVGEFGPELVVMDTSTPSIDSDLLVAGELKEQLASLQAASDRLKSIAGNNEKPEWVNVYLEMALKAIADVDTLVKEQS